MGAMAHGDQVQECPLHRVEGAVDDHENQKNRERHNYSEPCLGPPLAFIFAFPFYGIPVGQLHLLVHFFYGLFDGTSQIAPADAIFDRDISTVPLTEDLGRAVPRRHFAELGEGTPVLPVGASRRTFSIASFVSR